MNLKLAKIEITDLQARAGTDEHTIAEYCEAWKEGEKFPDVIVFHDGSTYFLADGFHRYFGAKQAGLLDINADVRKGGRKEALWFAVGANRTHGLKRTAADKRKAVDLALREKPELADNAIAKHIGVSFHLVKDVRSTFVEQVRVREGENAKSLGKREGLDGKRYPAPPARKPLPMVPPAKKTPLSPPTSKSKTPPPPQSPKKKDEPVEVLDKTGWPIPEKLLPLFDRAQEVQEILTSISRIKGVLRKAQEEKDKLFAEVNFSSALAQLDQAYVDVKTALPHAVCPSCQGKLSDSCTLCKARGVISLHRWDTCVARETKEMRFKLKK